MRPSKAAWAPEQIPLQYADWLGLAQVVERCTHYAHLGAAYQATETMRSMANNGGRYHPFA